ncbi:unnamed protein product [Dicrocoelium dendriticum]|nr:unnamed protein product [Dicrocoelium dendriticum]
MHGLQEGLLTCDRQPEHNHFSHKHEVPPFGNSDTPQRIQGFGCSKRTADANAGFEVLHAEGIMRSTGYEPYRKRNFSESEDGQEVDGTTFTKMKVPCVIEAPRNVGTEALNSKRSPKSVRDSRSEYSILETDHTQWTKATLTAQRKLAFASRVLCASTPCITPGWSDNYIPAHADSGSLSKDITRDTDWSEDGSNRKQPVQLHKQDYASHTLGEFFTREE